MAATAGPETRRFPIRFVLVAIVISALIAGSVGYLGVTGRLGGTIPGQQTPSGPPACEGRGTPGHYHFWFDAGPGGALNFNGTSPGPCVLVGAGSFVNVTFKVDPTAGTNHSWVLIRAADPFTASAALLGAGFTGSSRFSGIAPEGSANFSFFANPPGSYRYVCEVDDHAALGMFGWFNITAGPAPATQGPGRSFIPPGFFSESGLLSPLLAGAGIVSGKAGSMDLSATPCVGRWR